MRQVFETLMYRRVEMRAFRFKTDLGHWGIRMIEKNAYIRFRPLNLPYGEQGLFLRRDVFWRTSVGFPRTAIAVDLFLTGRLARKGGFALAPAYAVTSARRWRDIGISRATLVNYLIIAGCLLGVDPGQLAPLSRLWLEKR